MEPQESFIMAVSARMPGAIFQISAGDLCEFAQQLLSQAAEVARLQTQRADLSYELLTIDEVATMLKVSKMTLYRWDKDGTLTKIEVGSKRRYRRSDVEALINNQNE